MKTRTVKKSLFKNYLGKAEESFDTAKDAINRSRWNAAVANAVHCGISSADALTVFFLGVRHAGERHEDAITLLQKVKIDPETLKNKTKQLSRLLSIKNIAEYEEHLMTQKDAETAIKDAERFFKWVKEFLPTG